MEAISKKSGKLFTGKLAALMLRIGAAIPAEEYVAPEKEVKKPRKQKAKK